MAQSSDFKLSICIGTYNRAAFVSETLESIISQATNECEIIVSDNASTDDSCGVVSGYTSRFDRLRYIRQDTNKGLDRNYDSAVELARGEYCWLMPDDDLLKPGAVARVLQALSQDLSLVMVNAEYRNFNMSHVAQQSLLSFESDRIYGPTEMDRLFVEVGPGLLMYIGAVVIKRSIWLAREKEKYYGSLLMHVAVIFQKPLPGEALVIAEPLISYRMGNTTSYSLIEVLLCKWPSLVDSMAISKLARSKVRSTEPWRDPKSLFLLRGEGFYSLAEYQRWLEPRLNSIWERFIPVLIALLPGVLVNTFLVLYYYIRRDQTGWLQAMRQSRFHLLNQRIFKRET